MRSGTKSAVGMGLVLAAFCFTACRADDRSTSAPITQEPTAGLTLELQVGDLTVNTVHYLLTSGTNSYTGDLDVADASMLTAVIGGVVAGTYTLTLTATATDGSSTCGGSASNIVVSANQTATASVELRCTKLRNKGSVLIDGMVNECPDITSVVGDAPNGCSIALHVNAADDGKPNPPGMLAYTWSGFPGLAGASPTLVCDSDGAKALTVTVSDGDLAPGCAETFGVTVICPAVCPFGAPKCTDGIQNQGESDIDCGGPNCPACVSGKHCNSVSDCATGLLCVPTTNVCATPCLDAVRNCGGSDPRCPACPDTTPVSLLAAKGQACVNCANFNCDNELNNAGCQTITGNAATGPAAGQSKSSLCIALLSCELSSNCGAVSAANCYCGPSGGASCFTSGSSNDGACLLDEQRGLEDTSPGTILSRYQTTSFGGGRANKLINCLKLNGCDVCLQ
jgi:hypothetical protein